MKFYRGVERGTENNRLDFGGDQCPFPLFCPDFSPRNASSVQQQQFYYYSPDGSNSPGGRLRSTECFLVSIFGISRAIAEVVFRIPVIFAQEATPPGGTSAYVTRLTGRLPAYSTVTGHIGLAHTPSSVGLECNRVYSLETLVTF